jgi:hypothetical protein
MTLGRASDIRKALQEFSVLEMSATSWIKELLSTTDILLWCLVIVITVIRDACLLPLIFMLLSSPSLRIYATAFTSFGAIVA